MREVTATEAARHFSDLLDAVEHGRVGFAIVRHGKAIAHLSPVTGGGGRQAKALLAAFPVDPGWANDLAALRASLLLEERP